MRPSWINTAQHYEGLCSTPRPHVDHARFGAWDDIPANIPHSPYQCLFIGHNALSNCGSTLRLQSSSNHHVLHVYGTSVQRCVRKPIEGSSYSFRFTPQDHRRPLLGFLPKKVPSTWFMCYCFTLILEPSGEVSKQTSQLSKKLNPPHVWLIYELSKHRVFTETPSRGNRR